MITSLLFFLFSALSYPNLTRLGRAVNAVLAKKRIPARLKHLED
jgi:hypothetical protein